MKLNKKIFGALVVISSFLLMHTDAKGQCEEFLKYGLYDKHNSKKATVRNVYKKLTESSFESMQEFKSTAAGLGIEIPVEGIPIKGSASFSDEREKVKAYQTQLSTESRDEFYEYIENRDELISEKITDLVETCLGKGGLNLWIRKGGSDDIFIIGGRYVAVGDSPKATIKSFTIAPSEAYKIEGKNELATGKKVGGSITEVVVRRVTKQPITVSITSSENHIWIGDNTLPQLYSEKEISFNPTLTEKGTVRGNDVTFEFFNSKSVDVIANVKVIFNLTHMSPDVAHTTIGSLNLYLNEGEKSTKLNSIGNISFYAASAQYPLEKKLILKAKSLNTFRAFLGPWDRLDSGKTTIEWEVKY